MNKLTLSLFVAIIFIVSGLILSSLYISSKIDEEQIENFLRSDLKKSFPGSIVEIDQVKLKIGFEVKLTINKVRIFINKDQKEINLIVAKNIIGRINILSFLLGNAEINILIKKPEVSFIEFDKKNNWTLAKKGKNKSKKTSDSIKKRSKKTRVDSYSIIPNLFTNLKINLKMHNVDIKYSLRNDLKGDIILRKCTIKDFSSGGIAAFKITLNNSFEIKNNKRVTFDSFLIGEIDFTQLISKKIISTSIMMKISNLTYRKKIIPIANANFDLKIKLNKLGVLSGKIKMTDSDNNSLLTDIIFKDKKLSFLNINSKWLVSNIQKYTSRQYSFLVPGLSILNIRGSALFSQGKFIPDFEFNTMKDLKMIYPTNTKGIIVLNGNFNHEQFLLNGEGKLLGGTVSIKARSKLYDVNGGKFKYFSPVLMKISIENMNISRKKIRRLRKINNLYDWEDRKYFLFSNIAIEMSNTKIDNKDVDGNLNVELLKKKIVKVSSKLKINSGGAEFSSGFTPLKDRIVSTFDLKINHLSFDDLSLFFPVGTKLYYGIIDGAIDGKYIINLNNKNRLFASYNLKSSHGKIIGYNFAKKINAFFESSRFFRGDNNKTIVVNNRFDKININGKYANDKNVINKIEIQGYKNIYSLIGNGYFYHQQKNEDGKIDLKFHDKTGIVNDEIPIRLLVRGSKVSLDEKYTRNKILKRYKNKLKRRKN